MSITLKPEQEQFIQKKVTSGKYQSADEVISEALRLLEERDRDYEQWVESTREKVSLGIEELDSGLGLEGETVISQLQARLQNAREA